MRIRDVRITLDDVLAVLALAILIAVGIWVAAGLSPDLVTQ